MLDTDDQASIIMLKAFEKTRMCLVWPSGQNKHFQSSVFTFAPCFGVRNVRNLSACI